MTSRIVKIIWIVAVGSVVTACKPRLEPLSGTVSLEYAGVSAAGVEFILKNGSSKEISLRGERARHKSVDPWDSQVDCRAANGTTRYEHPVGAGTVCRRRSAAARQRSGHAGDAPYEDIVFGVDNIHAEIRSVGEVVPFSAGIGP